MSIETNPPEPEPDAAEIHRPLATPASMGYQAPAAPACRQDMTDEEIEVAFAALWRKLERCDD
jgi:hypothetical protein